MIFDEVGLTDFMDRAGKAEAIGRKDAASSGCMHRTMAPSGVPYNESSQLAFDLAQSGSFAFELTQIEQLCAANTS